MNEEEMNKLTEDDWARIVLDTENYCMEARIQASFHLQNAVKDENLAALISALSTDPSPIVRHELAFSLGESAYMDKAGAALMGAVENDENIFVRHEALLALATLGKERFIPFIERYLDDTDLEIRESAAIALERIRGDFEK
jgi:deoxyhypusine monooxygenase